MCLHIYLTDQVHLLMLIKQDRAGPLGWELTFCIFLSLSSPQQLQRPNLGASTLFGRRSQKAGLRRMQQKGRQASKGWASDLVHRTQSCHLAVAPL